MALVSTYDPTSLITGQCPVRHRAITLASGSNAVGAVTKRGTLLGRKSVGTAAVVAAGAGGGGSTTGNGTLTMDATTPTLVNAKPGVYTVKFTAATTFSYSSG